MIEIPTILTTNGTTIEGGKISKCIESIFNKFAELELSYEEASWVLENAKDIMGKYAFFHSFNDSTKQEESYEHITE